MINLEDLKKYDVENMYETYDKWPLIAKETYEQNFEQYDKKNINHIVLAGMGGSGTIGDIFSAILSKTNIHIETVKGYHLPNTVNKDSLVITTSVSGNTNETLSILKAASLSNCNLIAISSGGMMEKFSKNNNIAFRKLKMIHSPRASLTSFLYGTLKILEEIIPISKTNVLDSIKKLEELQSKISSTNLSHDNPSLSLSEWITGIPIIYYPFGLQSCAFRFKNSLQENAKMHVITEEILEATHNGIIAWEMKSNVQPILIRGRDDHLKTKERCEIFKEYFVTKNIELKEIQSIEGDILSKIMNLIYYFDYCSIYKAISRKINPTTIDGIDFVKNKMTDDGSK